MAALHLVFRPHDHVIAQIIKAKLAVGAIGDIGPVGFQAVRQAHPILVFAWGGAGRVKQECLLAVLGGSGHLQDAHR